ncbi:MAG: hypothetical protein D6820_13200, partial [Lentisphaerae bacterium]
MNFSKHKIILKRGDEFLLCLYPQLEKSVVVTPDLKTGDALLIVDWQDLRARPVAKPLLQGAALRETLALQQEYAASAEVRCHTLVRHDARCTYFLNLEPAGNGFPAARNFLPAPVALLS